MSKVYSDNIREIQKSEESVVDASGKYDLTRLSANERDTICAVIECCNRKYASAVRSAGLFNETYEIVYKARHILLQALIDRYKTSSKTIDIFACACAFSQMGAYYRQIAIECFELCGSRIPMRVNGFANLSPLVVYNTFSKLYEQEHQYDAAIRMNNLARRAMPDNGYYTKRENELRAKSGMPSKRRIVKTSDSTMDFNSALEAAAAPFAKMIK